ncbi:hypothetical protein HYDPIDRAFT_89273 [Hydnomerulius pinastri MD-312]|uniref:Uncharacterized protein n=1 Tax=Hydnomerulius pinastri MD-312 TaxID=994086 RepID=A0A0C9WAK7_9AGAM|nr:hypothetical protein HYDPIDRAFT_89273 [Hydnomerulius pinastri MD-312]
MKKPVPRGKKAKDAKAPEGEEKQFNVGVKAGEEREVGDKREVKEVSEPDAQGKAEESPTKKPKTDKDESEKYSFHEGVIERGHIYFFYRPKVQHEEAHAIDDIKNFHMLLVPRPPEFSVHSEGQAQNSADEPSQEMNLISEGADAAPARETKDQPKKRFRLITIGKKRLPDPEGGHGKENFWACATNVGEDLHSLERGLGERSYETKTRGTRHEEPARLAGRGVYAIANHKGATPSKNETHLGYHLSHPSTPGEVQEALGIHTASSFVLQVKNPQVNVPYAQRVGLPSGKRANYPEVILDTVFGKGSKGRSSFGLRFTTCHCVELLDYDGAELLLIAARTGAGGNDQSLGENRGEVLKEAGERESQEPIDDVIRELAMDKDTFPAEPLGGQWI